MGSVLSIDQGDTPVAAGAALQANADWTLGPLLVGWGGNIFLCGIVVSWAASYWRRAKGDKRAVKVAVLVAVVFEVLCAITNFWSLVEHGKDQNRTNDAISLLRGADALSVTLGTVVAVAVQSFFALRCLRVLPRRWRIPFSIWTWGLVLASFGSALGITVIEFVNRGATDVTRGASPDAYDTLYDLALVWLFCGAAADITISTVLIGRLWVKHRAAQAGDMEGGSPAQGSLFGFMRVTFEAALCTTVTALAAGVTYVTLTKTTNTSYAFSNLLPGLYASSLLWVLNSAHRLASEIDLAQLNSIQLVWNLGPSSATPCTPGAGPRAGGAAPALASVVHGEGAFELKRGLASAKACQRLGEDVRMLSIRPLGANDAGSSENGARRFGRGSIASLWSVRKEKDDMV